MSFSGSIFAPSLYVFGGSRTTSTSRAIDLSYACAFLRVLFFPGRWVGAGGGAFFFEGTNRCCRRGRSSLPLSSPGVDSKPERTHPRGGPANQPSFPSPDLFHQRSLLLVQPTFRQLNSNVFFCLGGGSKMGENESNRGCQLKNRVRVSRSSTIGSLWGLSASLIVLPCLIPGSGPVPAVGPKYGGGCVAADF